MKKLLILLLIVSLLGASYYLYFLNKRIEGVWIHNYQTDNDNVVFRSNGLGIWNIQNQKVYYHHLSAIENVAGGKYVDYGINFKLEPDGSDNGLCYKINEVNGDSLVLLLTGAVEREIVLKKIPDTLKNNSDWKKKLSGKAFERKISNSANFSEFPKFPKSQDTIYFDSQFIMHKNQAYNYPNWESPSWNLAKIEGFDIMFAHSWPTLILTENTNGIVFYGYDINGKMFKCELNEIQINLLEFKNKIRFN